MSKREYENISGLPEELKPELTRHKEIMLNEAIVRMQRLNMSKNAISVFENSDGEDVWMSEGIGSLYEINDNAGDDYVLEKLEEVREKGFLPYHVIHNITNIGEMFSILIVTKYPEEWEMDREDLEEGIVLADVYNKSYEFDDLGSIAVQPSIGGLIRRG